MKVVPKRPKVAILTPTYRYQFDMVYLQGMMDTMKLMHTEKPQLDISWSALGNIGATVRMRNTLVTLAMQDGATDLLFIDADIGWPPDAIKILAENDLPVLGSPQPRRDSQEFPYGFQGKLEEGEDGVRRVVVEADTETMIAEVHNLPTAFLRIKREVIEQLQQAYPELRYEETITIKNAKGEDEPVEVENYAFFNYRVDPDQGGTPRLGGEDYGFMKLLREQGIPVHIHCGMPLRHGRLAPPGGNLYNYLRAMQAGQK